MTGNISPKIIHTGEKWCPMLRETLYRIVLHMKNLREIFIRVFMFLEKFATKFNLACNECVRLCL